LKCTPFFSRVFELPLPRNAQKRTKKKKIKKKKVRTYFFLQAGADVRRFLGVFFLSPLGAFGKGVYSTELDVGLAGLAPSQTTIPHGPGGKPPHAETNTIGQVKKSQQNRAAAFGTRQITGKKFQRARGFCRSSSSGV
jgi:hypothetical protein